VVLAYETSLKESREDNLTLSDHVSHLVVHGVLHLLGFDHQTEEEAERMEAIERKALATLGIADPYVEERETSVSELSS
jgi:probable rRNA maturation factor